MPHLAMPGLAMPHFAMPGLPMPRFLCQNQPYAPLGYNLNSFRIKRQAIKVIFNIKDMKLKSSFVIFRTKSKLLVLTKQVLMLFRFSSATTTTANSLIPQQRRPLVSQRPLRGCCWSSLMPLSKTNRRGKKRIFDNN